VINLNQQIENNFKYHKADKEKGEQHDYIRAVLRHAAVMIDDVCPDSREKSLAITKLEEAMMWANAAIARN
jgi:hypothetical protein